MSAACAGVSAVAASSGHIRAPAKARVFMASLPCWPVRDRPALPSSRCGEAAWAQNAVRQSTKPSPARNPWSISHRRIAAPMASPRSRLGANSWEIAQRRSAGASGELFLLDRKDFACLHLDVAHQAGAPADVLELGVIAAGCDAGDAQPLVGIDGAVLVVLALIGTELGAAGRRQIEFRNRVPSEIPEARRPALRDRRVRRCDEHERYE